MNLFRFFFSSMFLCPFAKSHFPQNTVPLNKDMAAYKEKLVQMCRLFDRSKG